MSNSKMSCVLRRKKRHKWFSSQYKDSEEWDGPWDTVEDAILASYISSESRELYVCQGRRLTIDEKKEMGVEYDWECDSRLAFMVVLPPG